MFRRHLLSGLVFLVVLSAAMATRGGAAEPPISFVVFDDPETEVESEDDLSTEEAGGDLELMAEEDEVAADEDQCGPEAMKALKKKVAGAYKPVFYDNDFNYLCDPCYCDWHLGEHFKRRGFHDCWAVLDLGGQYRARYHSENNIRGLVPGVGIGLTGLDDDFLLHRVRLYGNLELGSCFRAYVEYLDANSWYEDIAPRPIEENRSDLLNAFGEAVLFDNCISEVRARVGRQELIYGAQRMISPLDWANTRRTFQGYKGMYTGHGWSIDGFYVNPVETDASSFDSPNEDEQFGGVWATKTDVPDHLVDLTFLKLLDQKNQGAFPNDFDIYTAAARIYGKHNCYLYEAWGAYQFGENTDRTAHNAGAFTLGLGREFSCHCWKPTVWLYYDWASGADQTGAGNGYNHLFPLAHKYLGFMDLYGRRNIETPNLLITAQPHEKVKLLLWYYYFMLQNGNDTPYSVVMTPYNPGNVPASRELGHEIDLTATYLVSDRTNILIGYSHFFTGEYYRETPGVPSDADADFFYLQVETNF